MHCQSKKSARRFGLIHETVWQLMQSSEFSLTDVILRLYSESKVHPQTRYRCRKVLEMYVRAKYLVIVRRPKDREWYYKVHIPFSNDDEVLSRREYLEALRDRNTKIYSKYLSFFDGILTESLD
jgi:hypothetical protein